MTTLSDLSTKERLPCFAPQPRDIKRQERGRFDVVDAVHKAEYERLPKPMGKKTGEAIVPAHKLEVNLEADSCTQEKHDVMLRYQTQIHKDPEGRWSEASFKRFLCNGLDRKVLKVKGKTMKLGSHHMCYRLDGKLVAVGVLDLLPHAVSSVYLFYDPDYQEWDWGKISALHEIALALEKGYEYYYMGYYIHSCTKMRYKGRFEPSYILDPESLEWNPLDDDFRKMLDERKYVSLSGDRRVENRPRKDDEDAGLSTAGILTESIGVGEEKSPKGEDLEVDSDVSEPDDTEIPEGSLFDYNIPGVLNKGEVENLNLGHMKLLVRTSLVDLEDLRGWEEWQIDDPGTIKGIAAELIATTGPKLLKDTALSLF